ncbi:MAG: hypothetical protein DSM107014_00760, partial [Gomphosphaeria aponina SAG 52.96 = DSM 107014]|nr:hypothetical protein [Gomphosphaeria aponina SAG 52.96 = DSM 107014]
IKCLNRWNLELPIINNQLVIISAWIGIGKCCAQEHEQMLLKNIIFAIVISHSFCINLVTIKK